MSSILTLVSFEVQAQNNSQPIDIQVVSGSDFDGPGPYIEQVGDGILLGLNQKMLQIRGTFGIEGGGSSALFRDVEGGACPSSAANSIVTEVRSTVIKPANQNDFLTQKISYFGCEQKLQFSEVIQIQGQNPVELDWTAILGVDRSFYLAATESRRIYRIVDAKNTSLIRLDCVRGQTAEFVNCEVFLNETKVLSIWTAKSATGVPQTTITPLDHSVSFNLGNRSFSFNSSGNKWGQVINAENGIRYYLGGKNVRHRSFDETINNSLATNLVAGEFARVIETLLEPFPQSKAVVQRNKLVQQSEEALGFLKARQNLELVERFIQEVLNAANIGQIQDKRP